MTRVNVGILPEELCDQMLLAELRERLSQMKRKPTWTNRQPPVWSTT